MFRVSGCPIFAVFGVLCLLGFQATAVAQFETRGEFIVQYFPYAIAVGDFNHDGRPDIAVASPCCPNGGVSILLGIGDGTFRAAVNYTTGVSPISIVAADLNHDGNLDLAVANSLSNYVSILIGNGDGTFQPAVQSPPVYQPLFVTVADFNGDGNVDLITIGGDDAINVLMGNGDGTFQDKVTTQTPYNGVFGVGDFNGDGKPDLAMSEQFGTQSTVSILLGNGDGTFRQGATYTGDRSPESVTVADFNGDHKLDFAVVNLEGIGMSVWLGNGDGTFEPGVNYATPFPIEVTAADINGDGKLDLVAANFRGGASVFLGNGDGTFQPGAFYPGGTEVRYVAVGDFNGDGKPDLVIADNRSDYVIDLLNTGVASFSPTTPLVFAAQLLDITSTSQTVALTNTGKEALSIASVSVRGPFEQSNTCGKSLAPAATCNLSVTFKPILEGTAHGLITLNDSASSKPQAIELSGAGTVVELSPQVLNFGDQKKGTKSAPLPVTITNTGSSALTFSSISLGFRNTSFSETKNCGAQLKPGAACTVSITFMPTKTGPLVGTLFVQDNGGGGKQTVALTGTGD